MDIPPPRFPPPPRVHPKRKIGGWFPTPAYRDAATDVKGMFKDMNRRKALFLALSCAITFFVLFGFYHDSKWDRIKPGPQLIYAESWEEGARSDAAIQAQQKRDQAVREEIAARRRAEFERLGKRLGID